MRRAFVLHCSTHLPEKAKFNSQSRSYAFTLALEAQIQHRRKEHKADVHLPAPSIYNSPSVYSRCGNRASKPQALLAVTNHCSHAPFIHSLAKKNNATEKLKQTAERKQNTRRMIANCEDLVLNGQSSSLNCAFSQLALQVPRACMLSSQ